MIWTPSEMFLIFYVIAVAKEPNSRIRCGSGNDFFFTEICLISSVFLEPKLCQELLKPSRPITDPPSSTCYPLFQITPVPNTNLWPQLFHSSHFSRSKALTQSSRPSPSLAHCHHQRPKSHIATPRHLLQKFRFGFLNNIQPFNLW